MHKQPFKKIGLVGWNGKKNIGDDAMTVCILSQLAQFQDLDDVVIWGDHDCIGDEIKSTGTRIIGIDNFNSTQRIRGFRTLYNQYVLSPKYLAACDLIVFGGGSMLYNIAGIRQFRNLFQPIKRNNPKLRLVAASVSLGPFDSDEAKKEFELLAKLFDAFAFRDRRSFELYNELELEVPAKLFPDIALSYPYLHMDSPKDQSGRTTEFGFSLRAQHFDDQAQEAIRSLLTNLKKKSSAELSICLFEFCAFGRSADKIERDKFLRICEELQIRNIRIVEYDTDPGHFFSEIRNVSFMFCMRLHAAIIAYSVNTPFVIIPYSQKCIDFGHVVEQREGVSILFSEERCDELMELVFRTSSFKFRNNVSMGLETSEQMKWLLEQ